MDLPAVTMLTTPTSASQLMRPSVRMVERKKITTKATATKTAVHVPWSLRVLRHIERLSMADPAVKMYSAGGQQADL